MQTLFLKKCFGNEKHKVLRSVSDQLDNFNSLTWILGNLNLEAGRGGWCLTSRDWIIANL